MNLSVIIPTYNGAHKILNVLDSLEQQTFRNFEVIVVVDGSTDNTINLLKSHKFNFQSFHIIEQTNQGRAKVRNNGAIAAKGNLLVFFDDDMLPIKDCLLKHLQHHEQYPGSILTGGLSEDLKKCRTDIQKYKVGLSEKWNAPLQALKGKPLPLENIFITAANFSLSKKTFSSLSGFDELLNDAEDYDLAIRAFQKNIPLYYNQGAFAWHDEAITCKYYINRQRHYSKALDKLKNLKPVLYNTFPMRNIQHPKGIKAIFFKLFTFPFWIWTIDQFNWMIIFPQILRYKIYELIIAANGMYYPEKVAIE